jgi:hypothetical protein
MSGQGDLKMRALTMDEVGFVSGGDNNRPWNPYENFRDTEPSQNFLQYEAMINAQLAASGLDYWGNPVSSGSSSSPSIPSTYSPSAANPTGSITAGNNAAQIAASYTTPSGTSVSGTITVPYNGNPPSVGGVIRIPF